MNKSKYITRASESYSRYDFISIGPKGDIKKAIQFEVIDEALNLFNLSFGDINENSNAVDDTSITDNGDMQKVLATVVESIFDFTNHFPGRLVYFQGVDERRQSLYNRIIGTYYKELSENFMIFGLKFEEKEKTKTEIFQKDIHYGAFIAFRKK